MQINWIEIEIEIEIETNTSQHTTTQHATNTTQYTNHNITRRRLLKPHHKQTTRTQTTQTCINTEHSTQNILNFVLFISALFKILNPETHKRELYKLATATNLIDCSYEAFKDQLITLQQITN